MFKWCLQMVHSNRIWEKNGWVMLPTHVIITRVHYTTRVPVYGVPKSPITIEQNRQRAMSSFCQDNCNLAIVINRLYRKSKAFARVEEESNRYRYTLYIGDRLSRQWRSSSTSTTFSYTDGAKQWTRHMYEKIMQRKVVPFNANKSSKLDWSAHFSLALCLIRTPIATESIE